MRNNRLLDKNRMIDIDIIKIEMDKSIMDEDSAWMLNEIVNNLIYRNDRENKNDK